LVVTLLLALQAAGAGRPPALDAAAFDPLVEDGIRRGAFPGAVLVVGRRDTVLFAKGYGRFTWSSTAPRPDPDSTIWDIASLTKVVGTTTALMILVERGAVRLDAPVVSYLPEFNGSGTAPITVRQLLTHTSGLRPTLPLARDARDAGEALRLVLATTPTAPPGSRVIYSDLNAILLGEIVRRRAGAGETLQGFVTREVLQPLGMQQTMYLPARSLRPRIVPTNLWRGHPIAGEVNDPSAHKLGGVAGHAGLFGTGADLARFARFILARGVAPDAHRRRLIRAETVDAFTKLAVPARGGASARGLGWQALPTDETVSSAGTLFGPRSFGHTGWTGTSLWIDPDRDLFVILLTNRAFAPRSRTSFTILKQVRAAVADAAARGSDGR
jgi:CubicO group peptidase (beta-lactamase class C family)